MKVRREWGVGVSRYLHGEHHYAVHFEGRVYLASSLLFFWFRSQSQHVWRLCVGDVSRTCSSVLLCKYACVKNKCAGTPEGRGTSLAGEKSVGSSALTGCFKVPGSTSRTRETMSSARHQRPTQSLSGYCTPNKYLYTRTHHAQRQSDHHDASAGPAGPDQGINSTRWAYRRARR